LVLDFDVESMCVLFRQIESKFYSFDTLRSWKGSLPLALLTSIHGVNALKCSLN
jgi:hypothetical protein